MPASPEHDAGKDALHAYTDTADTSIMKIYRHIILYIMTKSIDVPV